MKGHGHDIGITSGERAHRDDSNGADLGVFGWRRDSPERREEFHTKSLKVTDCNMLLGPGILLSSRFD